MGEDLVCLQVFSDKRRQGPVLKGSVLYACVSVCTRLSVCVSVCMSVYVPSAICDVMVEVCVCVRSLTGSLFSLALVVRKLKA